ncbi:MAG: 2-hydroxyglutaryl-CoA dehydratase, partial [Firmicutes bacterium]|nr:2-hydroxyglutaryl-CoA dehydratase [Bacillota bacterium]
MNGYFLGVDVGSVSTNAVLLDEEERLVEKIYLRTKGDPIGALREALGHLAPRLAGAGVLGVGATGSGRQLAGLLIGADVVKNEITAHAVAAQWAFPEVRTVIEIGGQDSKLIILRDGVVVDFAMNTVCAAGTGSFLAQQATRLGLSVEELGTLAAQSVSPVQIAGRCAVFAESDMIHKQQVGHRLPDILAGLCQALVRNYLSNLAKGKELLPPIVFQGGVAANAGIRTAFRAALGHEIHVPAEFGVRGAIGAALLAAEARPVYGQSRFQGLAWLEAEIRTFGRECRGCANLCEIVSLRRGEEVVASWGDRCGRW